MITIYCDNNEIPVNKVEFSDGAITFKIDGLPNRPKEIYVNVSPQTPVNLIREELTLIEDCFTCNYCDLTDTVITLNIPYMGYGRADRRFEDGNPYPLLGFLDFLSEGIWDNIHTCDLHNDKLTNYPVGSKIKNKTQVECYKSSLPHNFKSSYDYVVAPDKGATTKASTIAEYLSTDVVFASKSRDIATGRIIETTLTDNTDFKGAKVLIPDDIFDGGFTFIKLAEKLRERGAVKVDLYVTHLIASKGLECLTGEIDTLYYYNTVSKYVNDQDVLNFNLKKF